MTSRSSRLRLTAIACIIDAALVLLFAATGRSSHSRGGGWVGLLETAWPFLVGLAVMWLATLAFRRPLAVLRTGVPLWIGTVVLGMGLRLVSGHGAALPFVLVATISLGVLLVGWRAVAALVAKLRHRTR